ncbi:sulfatase-like hydrolase/transferase [Microbulbifer agarilyticus]|uniref:sulfatase-like hydrolase/transferase n=1 Tax=Microbulbifer agarilyticus TaxID=260552 RepID=UPI001C943B00|nr:sulfatase-like hydrolase/transferase [Microbulbifer agarilyticus]MBY6210911.1 sulfatase-like hydrolase/transferase [Microbulbifer agarilyticus]
MKKLTAILGLATLMACTTSPASDKPNFIVILTDDQGYADTGFTGSKDIRTPNIDRIAYEGTQFTNGYVTYAVCGPSRAGLLTGRYQGRFGFDRNPHMDPTDLNAGIPLDEKMISEVLQPLGYTSSIIGKWHMGTHPKLHPNSRGFNHFYGFLSGGHRYFPEDLIYENLEEGLSQENPKKTWLSWYRTKLLENDKTVEMKEYLTDALSAEAVDFIKREKDNPFFLYLAYNAPHAPLQATQEYLDRNQHIPKGKRRTYAAMISAVDDGVGAILETLEQEGIDDNTLVFFLSDNGGPVTKNGSNNGPLRGAKGDYFEGGIHVPFAMRWPKQVPAGITYTNPVSSLDIMATIASVTSAPINAEKPLDGVDLLPYLNGEETGQPHEALFWRNFDKGIVASRRADSKAILFKKSDTRHLYDLGEDLSEKNNLSKQQGEQFNTQRDEMAQWESEMATKPAFKGLIIAKKENQKAQRQYVKQKRSENNANKNKVNKN